MLCLFVSFPNLFIGAHAKKQGEDLADNDGDEDEGILFGDEGGGMCFKLGRVFFPNETFGTSLYSPHSSDPEHHHDESECE